MEQPSPSRSGGLRREGRSLRSMGGRGRGDSGWRSADAVIAAPRAPIHDDGSSSHAIISSHRKRKAGRAVTRAGGEEPRHQEGAEASHRHHEHDGQRTWRTHIARDVDAHRRASDPPPRLPCPRAPSWHRRGCDRRPRHHRSRIGRREEDERRTTRHKTAARLAARPRRRARARPRA